MRIAFVGKGGSGKTTLATAFCQLLAQESAPVFAIDADINQHLATSLGLTEEQAAGIPQLGNEIPFIKEILKGENPRIPQVSSMLKTTPPGSGSRLLRLNEKNPIWDRFVYQMGPIRLMVTGQFEHEDLGIKCFHAKTGAVELILNHTLDGEGEYLVVDMTAGADAFASGLFTRFDLTAVVVEPTQKSLSVYEQYASFASEYDVKLALVANKVASIEELEFIKQKTKQTPIACLPQSQAIRRAERGGKIAIAELEDDIVKNLSCLKQEFDYCQKDWGRFLELAKEFHLKNALSWGNASSGTDVTQQIDPNFHYPL